MTPEFMKGDRVIIQKGTRVRWKWGRWGGGKTYEERAGKTYEVTVKDAIYRGTFTLRLDGDPMVIPGTTLWGAVGWISGKKWKWAYIEDGGISPAPSDLEKLAALGGRE